MMLSGYWAKYPPVHVMVRAYMGVGKGSQAKKDLGELISMSGLDLSKSGRISKTMH